MAPRGFNISAPWRHRPDRDVSRRIPGQTLRHCHDACIAPDHGAQGGSRAPAQSPALRTLGRDAASGNGPAGAYAAWALLGGLGRPGWSGMYSQNPRGWKTGLAVLRRGAECAALLLSGRHDKVSDRRAPWRHVACARLGKGRAGKRRDVPLKAAGGPKGTGLGPFFSGPEDSGPSCLFFFPACRGRYAACGSAYARLPVMDAAVAIGLAFECVPDPGWLSAVVWAKPCAFAISRRAAGFARRALCFGCALAACLGFSALDPALPVAFLFRRT